MYHFLHIRTNHIRTNYHLCQCSSLRNFLCAFRLSHLLAWMICESGWMMISHCTSVLSNLYFSHSLNGNIFESENSKVDLEVSILYWLTGHVYFLSCVKQTYQIDLHAMYIATICANVEVVCVCVSFIRPNIRLLRWILHGICPIWFLGEV